MFKSFNQPFYHLLGEFHVCATLKPGHFVPFAQDEKLLRLKKVEVESESAFSGDNIFSNTPCSRCCSCGAQKEKIDDYSVPLIALLFPAIKLQSLSLNIQKTSFPP